MKKREIEQLMKQLRDTPAFGEEFSDADTQESWHRIADKLRMDPEARPRSYGFFEYAEYTTRFMRHAMVRPVLAGMTAIIFVMTGWVGAVNASYDSMPGDVLYPVKLVTERLQLTLATQNQRGSLQVEFAGRRLEEAVALAEQPNTGERDEQVRHAIDTFKRELRSIRAQHPEEADRLTTALNEKTEALNELALEDDAPDEPETDSDTNENEADEFEQGESEAVDTDNEPNDDTTTVTPRDRKAEFTNRVQDLDTRMAVSLGRLEIVETKLEADERIDEYRERIEAVRDELFGQDAVITEAMNVMAIGGFQRAFELLDDVETDIQRSEEILRDMEIEISTTEPEPTTEPEEPTETDDEEGVDNEDGTNTDGSL